MTGDCAADRLEPNSVLGQATPLAAEQFDADGQLVLDDLTLCPTDEDWYRLSARNGQVIGAEIHFDQRQGDLQLELLDEQGEPLARSAAKADNEQLLYTTTRDGPHYLRVHGAHPVAAAPYLLLASVDGLGCDADALEPNNSPALAPTLEPAQDLGQLTVCVGDVDWYKVELKNGQVLEATIQSNEDASDLGMRLYRLADDGTTIYRAGSDSLTGRESITYQAFEDGIFLIHVYRSRGTKRAGYGMQLEVTGDPCVDDAVEPNDTASEAAFLPVGQQEDLTLCVGDVDWYRVELANGQLLEATIDFVHAENDLGLRLYRLADDGTTIYRAGADTLSDGERVTYQPFEDGTFLLQVYRSRGTRVARYSMTVNVGGDGCSADAYEPNDSREQAVDVASGYHANLSLCVGDADWYRVGLVNGQVLRAWAKFSQADNDVGIRLYRLNDDGTISYRAGSDTLTDDEAITYQPYESGEFLLQVYRSRGTTVAKYDLHLEVAGDGCIDDSHEPNDASSQAALLTSGDHRGQTLCVGDSDWYRVGLGNGQVLSVTARFDHQQNDLGLRLYKLRADGTLAHRAGSDTLTDDEAITYQPYETGEFLLQVYRSRGTTVATYDIELRVTGARCVPDGHEPNNAAAEATMLEVGSHQAQTLCVGDVDWYRVELGNGQTVAVTATFAHAENDLGLRLYKLNADGTISHRAGSDTLTDNETISYQPYESGPFLLQVYRSRGTTLASYALDLALGGQPCVADAHEPNNAPGEARPLAPGAAQGLSLCVGDIDWYRLSLGNGQLLQAKVGFRHAENDLGLTLYRLREDGTLSYRAGADTLTDDESISYQPYDSGEFLLRVYRSRGTTVATYDLDLSVSGQTCLPDAHEPNDAAGEAAALATGSQVAQTLCVGDTDWYAFDAVNGQVLKAKLGFKHAENDLGLRLYRLRSDKTISYRSGSDTLSDNETIVYQPYETGTFLLHVYRTRGTTLASYDLELELGGAGCAADRFEPNDHWLDATPLPLGARQEGLTSCVGDGDYYAVGVAEQGQVITARAAFVHAENDFGLQLWRLNPDGSATSVTSVDSLSDDEVLVYTVPAEGGGRPHVLQAYRSRGTTVGSYALEVTSSP